MGFKVKEKLHEEQSQFQKIEVFDTESVGKLLTLDGKTMVSEIDEFVYHEVVSHIPYMVSRKTDNVNLRRRLYVIRVTLSPVSHGNRLC